MKRLFAALIVFAAMSFTLHAEDVLRPYDRIDGSSVHRSPFSLGLEVGANINFFSEDVVWNWNNPNYEPPTIYDAYSNAMGVGSHFALVGDYAFNDKWALNVRLGVDQRNVENSEDGFVYSSIQDYRQVPMSMDWDITSTWTSLAINARYSFSEKFFMTFGADFEFLASDVELTIEPTATDGTALNLTDFVPYDYLNNTNHASYKDKSGYSIDNRVALSIGAGWKFPLSDRLSLVPQVRGQFFLTKFIDDRPTESNNWASQENAQLHAIQAVIALWYNL